MNKQFVKLCLASILSLSLNAGLQARELESFTIFAQEEEEDVGEAVFSEIGAFIREAQEACPTVRIDFFKDDMELALSSVPQENSKEDIEQVLGELGGQAWISTLKSFSINDMVVEARNWLNILPNMNQLNSLALYEVGLGGDDLEELAGVLAALPNFNELHLGGCNLSDMKDVVPEINTLLSALPNLQVLDLTDNNLEETAAVLAPSIARMQNLRELNLNGNSMGESGITQFASLLAQLENFPGMPNLQSLNLANNLKGLEESGLQALTYFLASTPNLQELNLGNNDLGERLVLLIDTIASLPKLQKLNLHSNQLERLCPEALLVLADNLHQLHDLQKLDLSINKLGEELLILAPAITEMSNLQRLNLRDNNIDESILIDFVETLVQTADFAGLPNLQGLNLSGNPLNYTPLSEEGLQALGKLLSFTPELRSLELDFKLGDEGLAVLLPAIAEMANLEYLNLCGNIPGEEFAQVLAEMTNLKILVCKGINEAALVNLVSALPPADEHNLSRLEELHFDYLPQMGEDGHQALAHFLSLTPNLKLLNLNFSNLGEGLLALAPAIAEMTNLEQLYLESNRITGTIMNDFVNALLQIDDFEMPHLQELFLDDNNLETLDSEGWQNLAVLLSRAPNLSFLSLDNINLGSLPGLFEDFLSQLQITSPIQITLLKNNTNTDDEEYLQDELLAEYFPNIFLFF